MFKLFNPFKGHVVMFRDGTFGYRKMTVFGWQYLTYWSSLDDFDWILNRGVVRRNCHYTSTQMRELLSNYKQFLEQKKPDVGKRTRG